MTGDVVVGDGGEAGVVVTIFSRLLLVAVTLEVPGTLDFVMLMFEGVVTRADVLWSVNLLDCGESERLILSDKTRKALTLRSMLVNRVATPDRSKSRKSRKAFFYFYIGSL